MRPNTGIRPAAGFGWSPEAGVELEMRNKAQSGRESPVAWGLCGPFSILLGFVLVLFVLTPNGGAHAKKERKKRKHAHKFSTFGPPPPLLATGRAYFRRSYASFPPSSGFTAMSIMCVVTWRSVRGMIGWLCVQGRWKPEGAII